MNQKLNFELVQLFLIGIIPEQFLHLMMALITGSFIFWQIGFAWLYCGTPRLLIMLERRNVSFSTSVIFSFETILSDNNGVTKIAHYHKFFSQLNYCSNLSYFFAKMKHCNFVAYCSFSYFLRLHFWGTHS